MLIRALNAFFRFVCCNQSENSFARCRKFVELETQAGYTRISYARI